MLRSLQRMLTAFRHCLLTCPASAFIVAPIQTHPHQVCPHSALRRTDRQTDGPPAAAAAATCSAGHAGKDDVDQVLMDSACGHVLTSAGTISCFTTVSGPVTGAACDRLNLRSRYNYNVLKLTNVDLTERRSIFSPFMPLTRRHVDLSEFSNQKTPLKCKCNRNATFSRDLIENF